MMPDREKVIKGLEELEGFLFKEYTNIKAEESKIYYDRFKSLSDALALLKEQEHKDRMYHALEDDWKRLKELLKEQEEQKWKWLQTIADTQLAISPTGYESEDELAKRGWEWNGLQMAWEIIAGEERSEHPRLVRCKDCEHCYFASNRIPSEQNYACRKHGFDVAPDWYCADGERK